MIGVGTALPATVVPNSVIAERLGIDAEWIVKRTGIEERRSAQPGERLFEFAAAAGAEALAEAGVAAADVDLIVLATTSNEELMPAAAPRVAAVLGAADAACYDVNSACTGFLSAVSVACGQIESGRAVNVLVIGADLMMPLTDPDDRATAAVFADGAGAVLMRGTLESRVGPIVLRSDGAKRRPDQDRPQRPGDPHAGPRDLQLRGRPDGRVDDRGGRAWRASSSTTSTSSSTTRPTRGSCARSANGSASPATG